MNRCPICRGRVDAALARCTRCDTDLHFVMQIERICDNHCRVAIKSLHSGDVEQARFYASKALDLKCTPFTQTLFCLCTAIHMDSSNVVKTGHK